MSRRTPPDHRGPEAVAGLRQRLATGPGLDDEIVRLKRLTWAALERRAFEVGLSIGVVRNARTRDELRLAILKQLAEEAS